MMSKISGYAKQFGEKLISEINLEKKQQRKMIFEGHQANV